jgi:predicted NAD/FAD-binding protein
VNPAEDAGARRQRIAVIGSGIAGNVAAARLARQHEITVFEAGDHVGGHTDTHDIELGGRRYAVDTGFIVYNERTYPRFSGLLAELGVASQPTTMSFSVSCRGSDLEYNGSDLNGLFAQRRNLFRPTFWGMLRDILRFNREAPLLLEPGAPELTLGEYLREQRYARAFIDHYLLPMGGAIWSAHPETMASFPAHFFIRFFAQHGLLSLGDRPTWRVISGGSARYVERLIAPFRDRIRLRAPVHAVRRLPDGVLIRSGDGHSERFDAVFLACHSDQALRLLGSDATAAERAVLGAILYQKNSAVLHTDATLMPRRRRAWAAWNYLQPQTPEARVAVTYHMNALQGLDAPVPLLVTLNQDEAIDPRRILRHLSYEHPLFTPAGIAAQRRQRELNGVRHTYFCGAYWRNGFHEDGVVSAIDAAAHFNQDQQDAQRALYRVA